MSCTEDNFVQEEQNDINVLELFADASNYDFDIPFARENFQPRANAQRRPLKVRTEGAIKIFSEGSCSSGLGEIIIGEGNATHFGKFTVELNGCLGGPIFGYQTAANGDKVFTYVAGPPTPYKDGFLLPFGYYGGTGRFTYAMGEITLYIIMDEEGNFRNSGEGWISY